MDIRLTKTDIALHLTMVLSAKSVLGIKNENVDGVHVDALTSRVNSSYQHDDAPAVPQRRAKQSSYSLPVSIPGKKSFGAADVGVLGRSGTGGRHNNRREIGLFGDNNHSHPVMAVGGNRNNDTVRFLQYYAITCPDTCEPNLCACIAAGGRAYDCATELNTVCNGVTGHDGTEFNLEGCVNFPEYYRNLYCPFVKCLVEEGRTLGSCNCAFYAKSHELYGDMDPYDENTLQNAAVHACCQTKDEDDEDGKLSCFVYAPSIMPSISPSEPTTSPTVNPTGSPEEAPSSMPSIEPSVAATSPTVNPSGSPIATVSPTVSPEEASSSMPSIRPSASLTVSPSGSPIATVSPAVSSKPTPGPTTASPTKNSAPVVDNTLPTPSPTDEPSTDSQAAPSDSPSQSDPVESTTPPTPAVPYQYDGSSAQSIMRRDIAGAAMPITVAAIVWSLFG